MSAADESARGFLTPLRVELTAGLWVLLEQLRWLGSEGDELIVEAGEETDFASVPRLLQWLLPSAAPWVVRAAVVHDMLCRLLNEYWQALRRYKAAVDSLPGSMWPEKPQPPAFSAVDTDAVFRKIMRDEGAGWWAQRIGWVGVRWGALANPARRQGWLSTAPAVLGLSTLFLGAALTSPVWLPILALRRLAINLVLRVWSS